MKILHILNDGPTHLSDEITGVQAGLNEIRIIDLAKRDSSYEDIIDAVFLCDRVISW